MEWGDNRLTVSPECLQKKKKTKRLCSVFPSLVLQDEVFGTEVSQEWRGQVTQQNRVKPVPTRCVCDGRVQL